MVVAIVALVLLICQQSWSFYAYRIPGRRVLTLPGLFAADKRSKQHVPSGKRVKWAPIKPMEDMDDVVHRLKSAKEANDNGAVSTDVMDIKLVNEAIWTASRYGLVDKVDTIVTLMPLLDLQPSLVTHNQALKGYAAGKHVNFTVQCFERLAADPSMSLDADSYEALMTAHTVPDTASVSEQADQAMSVLDKMACNDIMPSLTTITMACEACVRANRLAEAIAVAHIGILSPADQKAVLARIMWSCRDKSPELLRELLWEHDQPTACHYQIVMNNYHARDNYDEVLSLYAAAQAGQTVNEEMTAMAIEAAFRTRKFHHVIDIAQHASDLDENRSLALIKSHLELGQVDEALQCMHDMKARGLTPKANHYSAFVRFPQSAEQLVAMMQFADQNGCQVTALQATEAVKTLGIKRALSVDDCLLLWRYMEQHGPKPELSTYEYIINRVLQFNMINHTLDLYEAMLANTSRNKHPPNECVLAVLQSAANTRRSADLRRALNITQQAQLPLQFQMYNVALKGFVRCNDSEAALQLFNRMRAGPVKATASLTHLVFRSLHATGRIEELYQLSMQLLREDCRAMDSIAVDTLIKALASQPGRQREMNAFKSQATTKLWAISPEAHKICREYCGPSAPPPSPRLRPLQQRASKLFIPKPQDQPQDQPQSQDQSQSQEQPQAQAQDQASTETMN